MTNRTTTALMAAALILAVPGHPRAQSPACPCGDPTDLVPLAAWSSNAADCSASGPLTATAPTRTELYGFSFEGGVVSLSSTVFGRDCRWVINAAGVDIQERPISRPQIDACSGLILSYAQALKDAGQVAVGDFGCKLR
jgi:hypothetical protein